MPERYEVGDLVSFETLRSGVVKGRVTAVYRDLDGPVVVWKSMSRFNNVYPRGIETVTPVDSPWLTKRERYNHG